MFQRQTWLNENSVSPPLLECKDVHFGCTRGVGGGCVSMCDIERCGGALSTLPGSIDQPHSSSLWSMILPVSSC